ncbi:heterodisulfide reductase [candidate division WOR-3 bacterium JGI_Cruoil_03_44_89]|uniref:Heterodisulfide reductase n=1 Tax=candidate division WOR-3 bacterium JGI_Cruoil_03_44_89 TaxID=1973748 RepID=A0A235BWJ8_UNCW3|nr:MAG: heterodisulfide reductase [candidate division WOR-3 bacterium JGI_Cruoil_03_44_89]
MAELVDKISELSGQNLDACYQCGKCSGGCPSVAQMDMLPNQVIRLLQIGLPELALQCNTIWICASCYMCTVRCPRGIDLSKIMEALRQVNLRENLDYMKIKEIKEEDIFILPQIALVANFRKQTA